MLISTSFFIYIYSLSDDITSFQTGVDTIYNGCKTYGSTPTTSTPSAIVNAIKAIYTNRYNAGVTATKKGTATAAQVLTGYTFTNSSSVGASGSMKNNGAVTKTFTPSSSAQSYTIPAGYHNGSGKVTCNAIKVSSISNVTHIDTKTSLVNYNMIGTATVTYTWSLSTYNYAVFVGTNYNYRKSSSNSSLDISFGGAVTPIVSNNNGTTIFNSNGLLIIKGLTSGTITVTSYTSQNSGISGTVGVSLEIFGLKL